MTTRDQFIKNNPLEVVMEHRGVKLIGSGVQRKAKCPFHDDKKPSLSVNVNKGLWRCLAGCGEGSVIDFIMKHDGLSDFSAFAKKYEVAQKQQYQPAPSLPNLPQRERREAQPLVSGSKKNIFHSLKPAPAPDKEEQDDDIDKLYSYQNEAGIEVYQVVRLKPKDFRQRKRQGGKWIWNLSGVERVLYHLPEVQEAKEVFVCEGEKDADNLMALGFIATTNCGGAKSWLDAYSDALTGKCVVICGDNDTAGAEHVQAIFDSIAGKAKTVRKIKLPNTVKDVSDFIETFDSPAEARSAITELRDLAYSYIQGKKILLMTMEEAAVYYERFAATLNDKRFPLGNWMPILRDMRPLVPGDMVTIIGGTSVGKTVVASSIALAALPLPTLVFQLELPTESMFERLIATKFALTCDEVEAAYQQGHGASREMIRDQFSSNLLICTESGMTLEDIDQQIYLSQLKLGGMPRVVIIDYLQLIRGIGKRRERFSDIAEGSRILAKKHGVVLILTSQISRPVEDEDEISLFDAKESGSIENSSSVVMGIWRDKDDLTLLHGRILKNTRSKPGKRFKMTLDGERMIITPRAVNMGDVVDGARSADTSPEAKKVDPQTRYKKGRYGEKED